MNNTKLKTLESFKNSSLSKIEESTIAGGLWKAVPGSGTCDPSGNSSYLVRQYILGIATNNYDTQTDMLNC